MEHGESVQEITYNGTVYSSCCAEIKALQAAGKQNTGTPVFRSFGCPSDPRAYSRYLSGPTGPHPNSGDCGLVTANNYLGVSGSLTAIAPVSMTSGLNGCELPKSTGIFPQGTSIYGNMTLGNGVMYSVDSSVTTDYAHGIYLNDVTDGTSFTMLMGERGIPSDYGWGWSFCGGMECEQYLSTSYYDPKKPLIYKPIPADDTDWALSHFWSYHPQGTLFVYVDGSTHFINYNIDLTTYQSLSTRNGGEPIGDNY
jgi:hypothetical protein